MKKILLFSSGKNKIVDIINKTYQTIPVANYCDLRDYLVIASILIVDAINDYGKALEFIKRVGNVSENLPIVVCIDAVSGQSEEEFFAQCRCTVIKEQYGEPVVNNIINDILRNVKNKEDLLIMKYQDQMKKEGFESFFNSGHKNLIKAVPRLIDGTNSAARDFAGNYRLQHEEILKSFSKVLTAGYSIDKLLDMFTNVLREMLKVSRIAVFLQDNMDYKMRAFYGISPKIAGHISIPVNEDLIQYLKTEGTILRLDSLNPAEFQAASRLRSMGFVVIVPLWDNGQIVGILGFNNKITGAPVGDSELELVFALGNQMAVAIENTKLAEITSQQRNYLENILDNVSCGIITVNSGCTIVKCNPKAEEILGIRNSNITGKPISELPRNIAELLNETIVTGNACIRKEVMLKNPERFIGVSITAIRTENGKIQGGVMIFTDLSPIKELEKETRRLDQLEFTNTVAMRSSHELKNCLVSIKTFAQLLPERYMDKQFREDFYLVVDKEVDRLNQVVENLLFFAQDIKLDIVPNNIDELVEETAEVLRKDDLLEGVEIVKNFELESEKLDVDRDSILRALKGILYNSIQAMPEGGKIHISVRNVPAEEIISEAIVNNACMENEISGEARAGVAQVGVLKPEKDKIYCELKITDQGLGVEPDIIDKIWDPFFTTKSRGIGLGLTIVRKIIETHGGRITVVSQPQNGTEMIILLPKSVKSSEVKALYFPSGRKVIV